jgi:hypothetical protein
MTDGANFSIPLPKEEIQDGGAPWPHVDQSPLKRELNCVQGIMNLVRLVSVVPLPCRPQLIINLH